MNQYLDQTNLFKRYKELDVIWDKNDKWHYYVYIQIKKYIRKTIRKNYITNNTRLLNAGSGGQEYGLKFFNHIHLDIVDKRMKDKKNFVKASIENIPFQDNSFDLIICVGSVINYCDALKALSEFERLISKNGILIIEFESSLSFEYLFTMQFNSSASIVKTFYQGKEEKIWVYSEKYIKELLKINNFVIIEENRFHIFSSFIYRLTKNINFSTKFIWLDCIIKKFKFPGKFATNIIFTCKKI